MDTIQVQKSYYCVDEVMELLGCKEDKAYKVMRTLKQELVDAGKLTPDYPAGKVPRKYFDERCCIC